MHVNNETGAVNDIAGIAAAVKAKNPGTAVHADGVQGYGKCPLDFGGSALDYYTASAHKLHGLKGTGVLFYKKNAPLKPYLLGGGQEKDLRSGRKTLAPRLCPAVEEYMAHREEWVAHMGGSEGVSAGQALGYPGYADILPGGRSAAYSESGLSRHAG